MASKTATVTLYSPTIRTNYDNVEVLSYTKDGIEFRRRFENADAVTITDYTSNLPYLITEETVGPKNLL